jgi:outer membrane protein OmpA-like peptidoglycan-associated protein
MSFNLVETVKNYFTPEFTNQSSSALGENSSGVSKALSAIIPTGLAGILNRATSGSDGANSIFNMVKDAAGNFATSPNVSNLTNVQTTPGASMVSNLFGTNHTGIISAISRFAGIKDSSASSLMGMVLPAIMGILGRHTVENNLSANGLSSFLQSQKSNIMEALPSGLSSITGMLGLGAIGSAASSRASEIRSGVTSRSGEVVEKTGSPKWLIPLIIILAGLALLWFLYKGCNKSGNEVATADTTTVTHNDTAAMATPSVATSKGSIKVKLPNGKELDALNGGIESQLVNFLNSDWKSLSEDSLKNRWFDFDNLNFNLGKATLLPESEKQLDNIAEILKAYPEAKIKIGGYTDASGNAAANKKLSQDRADAAKAGLVKRGVGSQVAGAEGYGSQYAKYPATASEEERALDRHVSVSVRK